MGSKKREFYIRLAQMPAPVLDILLELIEREEDRITAERLLLDGWEQADTKRKEN